MHPEAGLLQGQSRRGIQMHHCGFAAALWLSWILRRCSNNCCMSVILSDVPLVGSGAASGEAPPMLALGGMGISSAALAWIFASIGLAFPPASSSADAPIS